MVVNGDPKRLHIDPKVLPKDQNGCPTAAKAPKMLKSDAQLDQIGCKKLNPPRGAFL